MSIYNYQKILITKEIENHRGKHDVIYNGKHIGLTLMEFQVSTEKQEIGTAFLKLA